MPRASSVVLRFNCGNELCLSSFIGAEPDGQCSESMYLAMLTRTSHWIDMSMVIVCIPRQSVSSNSI